MSTKIIIIITIILIIILLNNNFIIENFDMASSDSIPKIIIQTWKDTNIPDKYLKDISSLKILNPTYNYLFFTDEDIENFLFNNYIDYYNSYKKLPKKIQKIDYFRYIAVYHYGGFYFDLDVTGILQLDTLLEYECIFPIDQYIINCNRDRTKRFCDNNHYYLLGQFAFAAKPKNNFIKTLIDHIHVNIDNYIYTNIYDDSHDYVYKTTGPDFVTDMYLKYPNKHEITIMFSNEGQYFGNYAKHNCFGTWK